MIPNTEESLLNMLLILLNWCKVIFWLDLKSTSPVLFLRSGTKKAPQLGLKCLILSVKFDITCRYKGTYFSLNRKYFLKLSSTKQGILVDIFLVFTPGSPFRWRMLGLQVRSRSASLVPPQGPAAPSLAAPPALRRGCLACPDLPTLRLAHRESL